MPDLVLIGSRPMNAPYIQQTPDSAVRFGFTLGKAKNDESVVIKEHCVSRKLPCTYAVYTDRLMFTSSNTRWHCVKFCISLQMSLLALFLYGDQTLPTSVSS